MSTKGIRLKYFTTFITIKQGIKHTIKHNTSYYLTLTVVDWVDVFTRINHKQAVIDSLHYCIKNKGLNVYAYCLMTNHLHLIVSCNEPFQLQDVIRDFKRHIVKQVLSQVVKEPESRRAWMMRIFKENGERYKANQHIKFWKTGNHAIELYSEKIVWQKINYIHQNPVKEGFVNRPEHWKFSSASNYLEGNGILEDVFCLPPLLISRK